VAEAGHLGDLDSCPVALVERAPSWLRRTVETYRAVRRLGIPPRDADEQTVRALLVLDDEAERLSAAEARRAALARG
jgi:hypothetical protein